MRDPGPRAWLAAGALASLAVQTRALFVGAALAFAWEALRTGRGLRRYLVGFAVALAPTLLLFALDPRAFLFGNLGVHGVRSEGGLVGDFQQKGKVVANLLGIATDSRPVTQYLLLGGAAVVAAVVARPRARTAAALVPRRRAACAPRAVPDTDVHAVLRDHDSVPDRRGRGARPRLLG